jgi:peptidyl-prolyl cis-trans isomerase B (cyclophilin B)
VLVASLLVAACGGGGDAKTGESRSAGAAAGPSCGEGNPMSKLTTIPRDNQRSFDAYPPLVVAPGKTYTARIETVKGTITIEFALEEAPQTVNNFVYLACRGYFDGLTFHRYEPNFVIQGGDPRGNGTGGPGYIFRDEFSPNLRHGTGVISMANPGRPNTNGSQFFITLAPAPHLDGRHSVFGKVTEGMDVVRAIRAGDRIVRVDIEER